MAGSVRSLNLTRRGRQALFALGVFLAAGGWGMATHARQAVQDYGVTMEALAWAGKLEADQPEGMVPATKAAIGYWLLAIGAGIAAFAMPWPAAARGPRR